MKQQEEISEDEFFELYQTLGAHRFEEKYNGDKIASLKWAILEEKRKIVRTLISKVLVIKEENGEKRILLSWLLKHPKALQVWYMTTNHWHM